MRHNGQIYGDDDLNVDLASQRLSAVRVPLQDGRNEELFNNQQLFIDAHSNLLTSIVGRYHSYFLEHDHERDIAEHIDDPHQKKRLRQQAFKELQESGDLYSPGTWLRMKRTGEYCTWKIKKDEYAKPGKKPRMIVDLGVSASLRGYRLLEYLKRAQSSEDVVVNGLTIHFCKSPDPFELEEIFRNLLSPPGRGYYVYFSDDACLSLRGADGVPKFYNLDISSCDSSHGPSVFELLTKAFPRYLQDDIAILIQQCQAPLRVRSRCANSKASVLLRPKRPLLYSGSTITTAINNLANLLIAISVAHCDGTSSGILAAAADCGYIVTGTEPLARFQELQFLKNSPVYDTEGHLRPLLNLGVLLRASGTCRGDLPGRGDLSVRARKFQHDIIVSAYPYADFTLKDRLLTQTVKCESSEMFADKVVYNTSYPRFRVDDDELYLRYSVGGSDIAFINDVFGLAGYMGSVAHPGLSSILEKDYGLLCL